MNNRTTSRVILLATALFAVMMGGCKREHHWEIPVDVPTADVSLGVVYHTIWRGGHTYAEGTEATLKAGVSNGGVLNLWTYGVRGGDTMHLTIVNRKNPRDRETMTFTCLPKPDTMERAVGGGKSALIFNYYGSNTEAPSTEGGEG